MRPLFDVSGTISKLGKDFSPYLAPVIAFCILTAPVAIYFIIKNNNAIIIFEEIWENIIFYSNVYSFYRSALCG